MNNPKFARALVVFATIVMAVVATMIPSGAQVGSLGTRNSYSRLLSYKDRIQVTGAGGADPLQYGGHLYPYMKIPITVSGDPTVSTWGAFSPWLTAVSGFESDPVNSTGANITAARVAVGGLQIIKTGAFTNYTRLAGDYVRVDSGTGAVAGYYAVASKDSNNQITLSTSAGAGHAITSDTQFEVIRPNNDPILWSQCYNITTGTRSKFVAGEPSFGVALETNYLVDSDSHLRHMEWYVSTSTSAGNPGTEYRPLGIDYVPSTGKVSSVYIAAGNASYGGIVDFRKPSGSTSGTNFASIGYTGSGGGNICGIQHLGNTGEDTILDLQAASSQNTQVKLGSNATVGAFKLFTASTTITRVDVGSSSNAFQWAYNDGGMSVAINSTNNLNGLSVKPMSNAYATIRGYSLSGQTLPAFQAQSSADAQTAGIYGENGAILSKSTGGIGYETGAGGTVTQGISRTTGVSINKTVGQITLVSAAGSTTPATFTVTNTTVAANDVIVINEKSGTDLYNIHITNVQANSFKVTFWTTGGTTTEQPVFSFAVIKGASS